jgi:hypothetical protein
MGDTKETSIEASAPPEAVPPAAEAPASSEVPEPVEALASKESPAASSSDAWPAIDAEHPLSKFLGHLPEILNECDHYEIYGVTLVPEGNFHTKLILQKFLRANANDIEKAKEQLSRTLKWRKEFQPLKVKEEVFPQKKFGGLGYITKIEGVPGSENKVDVCTFNIYGAVKENKETFGDLDTFMKWRVALMEQSVGELGLADATQPIPDHGQGADPYQGFQVHDYMNVSFLRQDPLVKAASKKAIEVFGAYYRKCLLSNYYSHAY